MRINTNISAMTANNALQRAQENLSNSIKRLSSGYKINSSADDPAGCAISEKMRMQIRGLNQADNNAADGESVLNTAEGALQEVNNMLARMKELAVQAANDVNSDEEREAIQQELDSINEEIDRIAEQTEFNTQSLMNGNLTRRAYSNVAGVINRQVSDNYTAGVYGVTIVEDARPAIAAGTETINVGSNTLVTPSSVKMTQTDTISDAETGIISINGYEISIEEGDDLNTVVKKLTTGADKAGVVMFATASLNNDSTDKTLVGTTTPGGPVTTPTGGNGTEYGGYKAESTYTGNIVMFMTKEYGSKMTLDIKCDNQALAKKLGLDDAYYDEATQKGGLKAQGNDVKAEFTTQIIPPSTTPERVGFADSAVISSDGTIITVTDVNSRYFEFDVPGNIAGTQFDDLGLQATATTANKKEVEQVLTDVGTMSIHIGGNQDQVLVFDIPSVTAYSLGVDTINVMTSVTAQQAITKVDKAIETVNSVRSKIGAYSNRLEHTRSNLAVSTENAEAALSTMMDTDMAEEMTTYTSINVLTQAATSILSQANERPATVLQLLQ